MTGSCCLQQLYPYPRREPVGRWIRHMQRIGGGANFPRTYDARSCCHRNGYIEALKVGPAVIKHKHDPRPYSWNWNVYAEAVNDAICLMRPTNGSPCKCRRRRARTWDCIEVNGIVREGSLDLRSDPSHSDVGHDAAIPA